MDNYLTYQTRRGFFISNLIDQSRLRILSSTLQQALITAMRACSTKSTGCAQMLRRHASNFTIGPAT
jgi:hypothetical protein